MKSGRRKQRRGKKMRECERRGRGGRKEWEKGGRKEKRTRRQGSRKKLLKEIQVKT